MRRYLLVILETVSAVGALGADIGSCNAARATRQAMEAQLFSQIMQEYATPTMAQSLRLLRAWAENKGAGFAEEFGKRIQAGEADAIEVEKARRQVLFHFLTVLRLHGAGYVPESFVRQAACAENGLAVLVAIVEPLRKVLNPEADSTEFDRLRQLCQRGRQRTVLSP